VVVFFHALTFAFMGLFGGYDGGGYLHCAAYVQTSSPDDGGGSMPTDGGGSMPGQGGGG
jgi:hypothetical protein